MHEALGLLLSAVIGVDGPPPATPSPLPPPAAVTCLKTAEPECPETWSLSLPEARGISLDTCEVVRLISRKPLSICQVNDDHDPWRFRAEIMAHLRSVEQQYWSLVQQRTQLKASEKAVRAAEEMLKLEKSELELSHGGVTDVVEVQQRLEQFRLDLITKTADVATTERQLRNIMGWPPIDGRRIVPISAPVDERREPDWDECLATMMDRQPDIIRQREIVQSAEMNTLDAIDGELEAAVFGSAESWREAAKEAQNVLDNEQRQRAFLTQVVHQTTHSLARFFLEIDANYKQFQAATRVREASEKRLDAQRKFYDEGRITADRWLDAVSQYASAVAQEAQFQTSYNVALVALEEAKGTLLSAREITVYDPQPPLKASGAGFRAN